MPRLVSVGEIIVELFGDAQAGYRLSHAGFAREMAVQLRGHLGPDWTVDLFTALGDDIYSQQIVDGLAESGVGLAHVLKIPGRNVGLSLVGENGYNGPITTNWRSYAAARLMADDPDAMAAAFDGADLIYVSGGAFAILLPRARGRLLKALDRARNSGARIVLAPLEWPALWNSGRVMGSILNTIATVADAVFTATAGEGEVFGNPSAEAIAARYHEWGVDEVLVRKYRQGIYLSTPAGGRWIEVETGRGADHLNAAYLAARAGGASPDAAVARLVGTEPAP